jgi:hypothetical protein
MLLRIFLGRLQQAEHFAISGLDRLPLPQLCLTGSERLAIRISSTPLPAAFFNSFSRRAHAGFVEQHLGQDYETRRWKAIQTIW